MKREPFPLQWPEGWKRTPQHSRSKSKFGHKGSGQVSLSNALFFLREELDRLKARNAVITSDLPTRNDGLPYADGRATDPGIAVWFVLDGHERVFACDKWRSAAENMQSIALSIEAMRGLTRWGASDIVTRAFTGFSALPPGSGAEENVGTPPPRKRDWREVFNVGESLRGLPPSDLLAVIKSRHRDRIRTAHPDAGGNVTEAAELNAALTEAESELSAS